MSLSSLSHNTSALSTGRDDEDITFSPRDTHTFWRPFTLGTCVVFYWDEQDLLSKLILDISTSFLYEMNFLKMLSNDLN